MTVNQCIQQLLEVEEKRKEDGFFCSLFFFLKKGKWMKKKYNSKIIKSFN